MFNNTPIVADGCVYLADTDGVVSAHNADTGEQLWAADLETEPAAFGGGLVSTPAIDGDLVFVIVNVARRAVPAGARPGHRRRRRGLAGRARRPAERR